MKLDGIRQKVFLDRYSLKDIKGNPMEKTPDEMWKRVAKGIASVEKKKDRKKWENRFYDVMEGFKFLPGGRILAGAGTGFDVTYYNCFVIPNPPDSRGGIMANLTQMIEIMAHGGGVGLNLSSLRPRGSRVKKVNGFSSGPLNWAELYSLATKDIVQQGGCFTGDARIMTHLGLISIEDIVKSKGNYFASTHKGFKKITTKFDNGIKEVFEIETMGGYKVKTTNEHKFLTFTQNGNFYLKKLSDLEVQDNLTLLPSQFIDGVPEVILKTDMPKPSKFSNGRKVVNLPKTLTAKLAFILGVYASDGSRIADEYAFSKGIRIAVDAKRRKDLAYLAKTLRSVFDIESILRKGDGNVINVEVYSRTLVEFLKLNSLLKENSNNVFVPESIFTSPRQVVEAFIAGVFFGDGGNRGGKGGFRLTSVNKKFIEDLQLLLLNLNVASKITKQVRGNWQDLYTLNINGARFMRRFFEIIAPYNEKALDNAISIRDGFYNFPVNILKRFVYMTGIQRTIAYTNPTTSYKTLAFMQNNIGGISSSDLEDVEILTSTISDKIKKITRLGFEQVYDLEVEDVHLLSGNGFYTSNSRRGALMLMLHDWHPDIEEFITVKQDLTKINGANLSVCLSDAFMEAVKKNANWDLIFADLDDKKYDKKWTGDMDAWKKMGGKVKVIKTVKAKYLWDLICQAAWRSAEPGLHFLDRSNKRSNTWYFETLTATNPSLRAGTQVLTKEGIFAIEKLEGKRFLVKNLDGKWSEAECFLSGKNKKLYKVKLSNGREIFATAEHKWPVALIGGGFGKVTTDRLKKGNILPFPKVADIDFDSENTLSKEQGFMIGWLYGDGWISERKRDVSFNLPSLKPSLLMQNRVLNYSAQPVSNHFSKLPLGIHSSKKNILEETLIKNKKVFGFLFSDEDKVLANKVLPEINKLKKMESNLKKAHDNTYTIQATSLEFAQNLSNIFGVDKKENGFPLSVWQSGSDYIKGFVDGLISSDGFVTKNSSRIVFTTKHKKLAEDFSSLISFYGIKSNIRKSEATKVRFPNHKEYSKIYERYDVSIDGYNVVNFGKIFKLSHQRKQQNLQRIINSYKLSRAVPDKELIRIDSVEETNLKEDVWDISVYDNTHCFYINHAVTGNCGEQPLSPWAVCNLGAMNLAAYVDKGEFDYENFGKDVRVAMRFLDNVIDDTHYFYKENEKVAKDIRRTGLGILGLADALIKMKIKYGAEDSLPVIEKIFKTLRDNAYIASSDNAAEKGSFPKYNRDKYQKGWHIKKLPEEIRQKIYKQGIRNAVLLTIAPTGTTSLISGVSSGVEPVYEFEFIRRDRLGEHLMYHPLFEEWKKQNPKAQRPDYFVSANDLTPEDHIKVQAVAQDYIDSSISKTVNAPKTHTVEDVKNLYTMAFDMGLKGITYMRDGSREGVLSRKEEKKDETAPQIALPSITAPEVPRPMMVEGVTYGTETPVGKTWITINHDANNQPFEVFIIVGKAGSDVAAMADALGRMISLNLRINGQLLPRERIRHVVAQLIGIGGARSVGFGENKVRSLPDAVAKVLSKHFDFRVNGIVEDKKPLTNGHANGNGISNGLSNGHSNGQANTHIPVAVEESKEEKQEIVKVEQLSLQTPAGNLSATQGTSTGLYDICPECGGATLAYEEGCKKCYSCGYSEC